MKTIGSIILLSIAMLVLVGTIIAEDILDEADNSTEAVIAQSAISPILTVLGFAVLIATNSPTG